MPAAMITDLEKAGWVRVGPYSPYWKAPDDTGPAGRKWSEASAHAEMTVRQAAKKAAAAAKREATAKRKAATSNTEE